MKVWWANIDIKKKEGLRRVDVLSENTRLFRFLDLYDSNTHLVRAENGHRETSSLTWRDEDFPKPNFLSLHMPALCMSQNDFELLASHLDIKCSIVKSKIDDETYCSLIPSIQKDWLSLEYSDSKSMKSGNIGRFTNVVFNSIEEEVPDLFSVVGPPSIALYPFVSDRFKSFCDRHTLTGLDFKAVDFLS